MEGKNEKKSSTGSSQLSIDFNSNKSLRIQSSNINSANEQPAYQNETKIISISGSKGNIYKSILNRRME